MRAHQGYGKVRSILAFVIALSISLGGLPSVGSVSATLSGDSASSVAREPQLQPDQLGNGVIDGLQYADPTEGLALVSPPVANSGRGAQVEYPFVIPPGRGITPEVSLGYDSGGENGWVGLGWDLSVGEISVDTSFGAPHFDAALESESYLLNGDLLTPNANSDVWTPRVAERQDYTRQVETEYQQIIRHGSTPKTYFWEVHDKFGNVFWYGGKPDPGGPYGDRKFADIPDGTPAAIDTQSIVFDDDSNTVKWYLSAQRDVGVNQIRYYYTPVTYVRTASSWSPQACAANAMCGRHLYLDHIDYTEAAEVAPDPGWVNDAPYRVEFLRESTVNPTGTVRPDPIVDGSLGFVDVINDRLAQVVVMYGDPKTDEPRSPRDYNKLAVRYDLQYEVGPFGKSLLSRVGQISTTSSESAWHEFDYSDPLVRPAAGGYSGFGGPIDWNTAAGTSSDGDIPDQSLLNIGNASVGALGTSVNNSAEGHVYLGFNAAIPDKNGSFGGTFQIGGGGTEALAEWIDLNGDTLPDKVWKDGGTVKFRLNQSGPSGGGTFGAATTTGGDLPRLSRDTSVNFQLAVEAHFVVNVAVGIGGDIEIGDSYFTDVNADGLVDFVSAGSVYFNRLVGGIPTFSTGSTGTLVPLPSDGGTASVTVDKVAELQANLEAQSPPIDTVKRWIAPYGGTISINAPATMTGVASKDGVRVAIQHNDTEKASANLLANGSVAPLSIPPFSVAAGDEIFFRVGSVNDGANDEVAWDPTITYTAVTGVADLASVPLDANGLSQLVFHGSSDFTLAGRPNSAVVMPKAGVVHFEAAVIKPAAVSDDMRLVVKHNGTEVTVPGATISAAAAGTFNFAVDVPVAGPVFPTEDNPDVTPSQDTMEAYLAVDSPIDLTKVSFAPSAHYISDPTIVVDFLPEIEQYPHQSPQSVATTVSANGTYDVEAIINRAGNADATTATMTVKTAAGVVVDRDSQAVGAGSNDVTFNSDTAFSGGQYFIEFMLRNDNEADTTTLGAVTLHPNTDPAHANDITGVAATLRWRGPQGVFPLAYRGWGVAGYTAAGTKATTAITRSAFVKQPSDFDNSNALDRVRRHRHERPRFQRGTVVCVHPQSHGHCAARREHTSWRANGAGRENHAANGTTMRTSRLGADSVALSSGPGVASGTGTAVTRVGVAAPSASLAIGVGPFGGSFGIGPSFGLVDYEDMNGDGYPDVLTPGSVHVHEPARQLPVDPAPMSATSP